MMTKTHLVITLFFILILLFNFKLDIFFILIALLSGILPDLDTKTSKLGKNKFFRPFQLFFSHRGFMHSFNFLFLVSLIFYFFFPFVFFPFLLGYGLHLIIDSFTKNGIMFFYPFGKRIKGPIKTGSKIEYFLFVLFLFFDFVLVLILI